MAAALDLVLEVAAALEPGIVEVAAVLDLVLQVIAVLDWGGPS